MGLFGSLRVICLSRVGESGFSLAASRLGQNPTYGIWCIGGNDFRSGRHGQTSLTVAQGCRIPGRGRDEGSYMDL